jgi:endonuclease/exonuclease/phosphatase family metal-dependent hydrolase
MVPSSSPVVTGFRLATLNCLNLALPNRPIYDGWPPYTADEYLAKTQWLATMLDRLAADFILLQEVFHEKALSDVVRQTVGQGRAWSFTVPFAGEDNRKPRLGLMWRTPWQPTVESIVDLPEGCAVPVPECAAHARFSRPLVQARVPMVTPRGATTLTLINVHLKSRRPELAPGEDPADPASEARGQLRALLMRAAEAAAVRRLVVEATQGAPAPLIVAGDFNDEANAVTTQIVADTSWKGEHGAARAHRLCNALDVEEHMQLSRARDVAYTIVHGGAPERIDHVLVSEALVPGSAQALGRVAAVQVLNDHLSERRQGRWRTLQDGLDLGRILSDHAAVCVSIVLDDASP